LPRRFCLWRVSGFVSRQVSRTPQAFVGQSLP
jgi:hypothetical protein